MCHSPLLHITFPECGGLRWKKAKIPRSNYARSLVRWMGCILVLLLLGEFLTHWIPTLPDSKWKELEENLNGLRAASEICSFVNTRQILQRKCLGAFYLWRDCHRASFGLKVFRRQSLHECKLNTIDLLQSKRRITICFKLEQKEAGSRSAQ